MSRSRTLTRNPTVLSAILSVAALAGYVAYRLTLGAGATDPAAETAGHDAHEHTDAMLADSLPAVVLPDLAGTPTSLASWAGRPLIINFWATWCGPCLREIPLLLAFQAGQDQIQIVGIAVDRLDDVLSFAEQTEFNYPNLVGYAESLDVMAAFQNDAGALPFSAFIAADGATLGTYPGELHQEHLDQFAEIVELLAAGRIDRAQARTRLADALDPE
jgi:thiol-disulfide isomerase/thioredoxin